MYAVHRQTNVEHVSIPLNPFKKTLKTTGTIANSPLNKGKWSSYLNMACYCMLEIISTRPFFVEISLWNTVKPLM